MGFLFCQKPLRDIFQYKMLIVAAQTETRVYLAIQRWVVACRDTDSCTCGDVLDMSTNVAPPMHEWNISLLSGLLSPSTGVNVYSM